MKLNILKHGTGFVSWLPRTCYARVAFFLCLTGGAGCFAGGTVPVLTGIPVAHADLPLVSPAAAGFDPERLRVLLETVATSRKNIHGLVVERGGRIVAELYLAGADRTLLNNGGLGDIFAENVIFDQHTLHDVRSISKSVVGLLFGMHQGRGAVPSPGTPVLDFYPELADLRNPQRGSIKFRHLLTMSSGLDWTEWGAGPLSSDELRLLWKAKHARFVLDRPQVTEPGTQFEYNGGGTAILADVLSRGSGRSLLDIAREDLFEPLDIREWEWATDFHDRPQAYAGLRLRPRDMVKLGRLLLNEGRWQKRQIVPAGWVRESLRTQISTGITMLSATGDEVGYGYQWWTGRSPYQGRVVTWSAAIGNGGQRIYVVPELDLIVAITAGAYGSASIGRSVASILDGVVASVHESDTAR